MRIPRKLVAAGLLLSLLTQLVPSAVANADEIVAFSDVNLETAIRREIGKPTGDIYKSDLEDLTSLNANSEGIIDLAGLEYCTSLAYLSLWGNRINDITPLSSLRSLNQLGLGANEIDDVSALFHLSGLKQLWLAHNQISDISPLSDLTDLTLLDLSENQISDISPLSSLTGLTELYLRENQIRDISPLSNLTSLTRLWLSHNGISDISPLVRNGGLSAGDTVNLTANPLNSTSVNLYIPQLEQRGVTVSSSSPYTAPSTPEPDGKAPFNVWVIVGPILALLVGGGVAYYFLLLRRVVRKRAVGKK